MDATMRFDTKIVGSLPVISNYLERLHLADIIDQTVPWEGEVPLGTLVEVMVINRLLRPAAMFRLDDWAQTAAVTEYYGLAAGQLNDDRLGRALERVAKHADRVQPGLVLNAMRTFKLNVDQIHYDMTSVELFGAYELELAEGQEPPRPLPTYGRSKSGRKNVKQVQLGIDVTGDGGVPVAHAAWDGNTAEQTTHVENLRRLKSVLPKSTLLYIADSKLDTPENLVAVVAGGGQFLCAGAFLPDLQQRFLRQRHKLRRIDYCPKSQQPLPPEKRDRYLAFELSERLQGEADGRKIRLQYRLIFVWSEKKAEQEAATRERHMAKIREAFADIERNLNRYSLKTEQTIIRRLETAKGKYDEGKLFDYQLTKNKDGQFQLQWKVNAKGLEEWQRLEGVYVLKTNLSKRSCPLVKALAKYKEQSQVERRLHHLKGPLAVAPMFLKNPERIAGLLCILVWALMVMALMERQVRRNLKGKPLYGLYPENRPSPAPTGPALLECFWTLCIVIMRHHGEVTRRLADASGTQRKLLDLLGIPPDTLRAFKRRCRA